MAWKENLVYFKCQKNELEDWKEQSLEMVVETAPEILEELPDKIFVGKVYQYMLAWKEGSHSASDMERKDT